MASSYNGWTASKDRKAIGVVPFKIAGVDFPGGVKSGDVATVLGYVAEQFNKRVEKLVAPGCWGHNFRFNRNANNLSCHASGTAIDCNAPKHPNGKFNTFTARQITEIRLILAEVDNIVEWGRDFSHTKDEMHFEIKTGVTAAMVKKVADKIRAHQAALKKAQATKPVVAVHDPELHQGTKGAKVKELQTLLIRKGIKVIADGDFGPGTKRGLVTFQISKKLPGDGIAHQNVWNLLRK